jgi:hypothetical protein
MSEKIFLFKDVFVFGSYNSYTPLLALYVALVTVREKETGLILD